MSVKKILWGIMGAILVCSCQQQRQAVQLHTLKLQAEAAGGQYDEATYRAALRYERNRWFSPVYFVTVHLLHPQEEKAFDKEILRRKFLEYGDEDNEPQPGSPVRPALDKVATGRTGAAKDTKDAAKDTKAAAKDTKAAAKDTKAAAKVTKAAAKAKKAAAKVKKVVVKDTKAAAKDKKAAEQQQESSSVNIKRNEGNNQPPRPEEEPRTRPSHRRGTPVF